VCPVCSHELPDRGMTDGLNSCILCGNEFEAATFDPPRIKAAVQHLAPTPEGDVVVCATHEANPATESCTRCGIFMCSLCSIAIDGMTLCPACYDRLTEEGTLSTSRKTFRDFSSIAVTLLFCGALPFFWFFSVVLGIGADYFAVKGIAQKKSMGEQTHWLRATTVICCGMVETILGGFFIASVFA
jgi:hypothetical protein